MEYTDLKNGDVVRIKLSYKDQKEYEFISVWYENKFLAGFYDIANITPQAELDYGWDIDIKTEVFEILEYYGNVDPHNLIPDQYKV